MGPKKGENPKANASLGSADISERQQLLPEASESDLSESQRSKRKRDDNLVDPTLLTPVGSKSTSLNTIYNSSAGSSNTQSTNLSSVSSTSSGNRVSSCNYTRVLQKGRINNKSHIVFNSKKQVYLQDSLDPIEESSLLLNDEKVYKYFF